MLRCVWYEHSYFIPHACRWGLYSLEILVSLASLELKLPNQIGICGPPPLKATKLNS